MIATVEWIPEMICTGEQEGSRMRDCELSIVAKLVSTSDLALFPGSPPTRTASDGKLGGAWERGYI